MPPAPATFLKCHRIRSAQSFAKVYQRRQSAANEVLLVYGCENGLDYPRLGLSVSRKVGGAVVRNRWKRLLREAFRHALSHLPAGIDLVVIPRHRVEPDFERVSRSLQNLAHRLERQLARDGVAKEWR